MPVLFWLDVAALVASTVIAAALAMVVLGSGWRHALSRSFAPFIIVEAVWAVFSLLARLSLWLERGDALFFIELAILAFVFMGPLLLLFTVRYIGRPVRWADAAAVAGLVAMGLLSIPLFRHSFVLDVAMYANGTTITTLSSWAGVVALLPALYLVWALVLFWQERGQQPGGVYLALSILLLLFGFIVGGLLNIRIPLVSITTTLSAAALGYGVISRQIFNPLRRITAELERKVEERTRELEEARAKVEGWVEERTTELKKEIAERQRIESERAELLRAFQHSSTQLRTAIEVSKSASLILDPEALISQTVHLIQERFDFYYVGLFLLDQAGEYAVLRAGTGNAFVQMAKAGHKLGVGSESMIGWCTAHGKARISQDVREEKIRLGNPLLPDTRSEMALPLVCRGRCIGALTVQSVEEHAFTQEDVDILQTMADQVAVAIENARLLEAERKRGAELEALRQASLHVTSSLELQPVLEAIIEHGLKLVSADNAHVFLYDGEELTFGAAIWAGGLQREPFAVPRANGLTYTVARKGERIVVPDVDRHPLFQDRRWGGAVTGFPLRIGDEVRGVMNVAFEKPHVFTVSELNALALLADQAAIAIHNARLHQQVRAHAEELAIALEQQEELDRLKGEFVQNVSHELRSPLALIRGYAEVLHSGELGELSPDQDQPVSIIMRRSRMLSELVEDITLILGAETRPVEWESVALDELARVAVREFQVTADRAVLTMQTEIAEVPPVRGSLTHLRRVLDNLLSNAVKFTPEGGTITVRVWPDGEQVVLQVCDTGIGIPADQLERIFDRFYQVDGSARRRYGGVGLGLALVKELVELHGGEVAVESEIDEGSVFTVTLPVLEPSDQDRRSLDGA